MIVLELLGIAFILLALSFFDFNVEWDKIIPISVQNRVRRNELKIWFLYSEGDNPFLIQKTVNNQLVRAGIPMENVHFSTANTKSRDLAGFGYICDDELLYRLRNESLALQCIMKNIRSKNFTALVRTHKELACKYNGTFME